MARKLAQLFFALLTLILLSPRPSLAQPPTPHFEFLSQPLTFYASDSVVSGNTAYVAAREDLYVFDISDPGQPSPMGPPLHVENCHFGAIDLVEPDVIVTQNFYGCPRPYNFLAIVDVSDPSSPEQVGESIDIVGAAYELAVEGGYAFVANGAGGLTIVNLSSRDTYNFTPNGAYFEDIKIAGDIAYLTDGSHKLWLLDISDKENINASDVLDTLEFSNHVTGVDVAGNYAYVSLAAFLPAGNGGLGVINVANPRNIYEAGRAPMPDPHAARDVEVEGSYAFVVDDYSKLVAFDISVPSIPTPVAEYQMTDEGRLTVSGDLILASNGFGGLVILRFTGLGSEEPPCNLPNFGDANGNPLRQKDSRWGNLAYGGTDYTLPDGRKIFLSNKIDDDKDGEFDEGWEDVNGNGKKEREEMDTPETIGKWGCAITSSTMIINYFAERQGKPFKTDPKQLNEWLQHNNGYSVGKVLPSRNDPQYVSGSVAWWDKISEYASSEGGIMMVRDLYEMPASKETVEQFIIRTQEDVNKSMCDLNPVIFGVTSSLGQHYIDATGKTEVDGIETWQIHDPELYEVSTLEESYSNTYNRLVRYNQSGLQRSLDIRAYSDPVELLLTDSQGRRVGFDSETGGVVNEIQSASYGPEFLAADDETRSVLELTSLDIILPSPGEYTLEVIGTAETVPGPYNIEILGVNNESNSSYINFTDTGMPAVINTYKISYGISGESPLQIYREILIDIKPGDNSNVVNLKSKGVLPISIITTSSFNAADVVPDSIRLGENNVTEIHGRVHLEETDGDGDLDLMLHFSIDQLELDTNDDELCLSGRTYTGVDFKGCDRISIR